MECQVRSMASGISDDVTIPEGKVESGNFYC